MMHVADVDIEPNAIFGMLLAAEGGASLDQMAHFYGLGRHEISSVLDRARRGEAGKIGVAAGGEKLIVHAKGHGPVAADRQEVLVKRWMRRIARHLHRHGEISLNQVRELVDTQSEAASVWMEQLRLQFKALGITYRTENRGGPERGLFYVIEGKSRELLAAVIDNDWKIEVER